MGRTTWKPLPPESLTKLCRSSAAARSRTSRAAGDARRGRALAGMIRKDDRFEKVERSDGGPASVQLEDTRLYQGEHAIEVFDCDHLPPVAINDCAEIFLVETGRGMLLEEALAAHPVGTADERKRPVDYLRRHPVPDQTIVVRQILLGDALIGPIDAVGMGEAHLPAAHLAACGLGSTRSRPRF